MLKSNKNRQLIYIFIALVVIGIFVYVYFFKKSYNNSSGDISVTEKQTSELPKELPSDFPIPEDSQVVNYSTKKTESIVGTSIILNSKLTISDLTKYYESEFQMLGWEYSLEQGADNFTSFTFKKDNYKGFLGLANDEAGSIISVTIRSK
jgi:hypothetical protein